MQTISTQQPVRPRIYNRRLFHTLPGKHALLFFGCLLFLLFGRQTASAQTGLINDDFATGNTNGWTTATAGSSAQVISGQWVVTMAVQSAGKYRADIKKTGGVVVHAGNYPIVAIKFNKPPRCNFFFDTNLGSYNNTNNNAAKLVSATGNIYYWDLSTGKLGSTTLSKTATTNLTVFQFKIADIVPTQAEIAANDLQYEVDWVRTYASVAELRAAVGVTNPPTFAFTGTFAHPGLLHNTADLQRMKGYVTNHFGRPYASYQLLQASPRASASYNMAGPYQYLTRDAAQTVNGVPGGTVKNGVESDFLAAYYNALMWNITGNEAHAAKAVQILNAYGATTQAIIGADAALNGLYGCMLANAAEIMRYTYSGWGQADIQQCQAMLKNVFYPTLQNFSSCSHGNWDIICMKALLSIAVFSNDTAMFNKVVNYFYHGEGNGSIDNYVLTAAGQLQESNRDQPHTMLALGSMAELAEMALKQGVDLYAASGNAIMRGYEYTAKYNLGNTVDYQTAYDYCEKNYTDYTPEAISDNGRGQFRPVFEIAYAHYVYRKGLEMPWTLKVLGATGPEGAPFGADNPGYGSLFFYLNTAPDYTFDSSGTGIDPNAGLINDNFNGTADGWAAATAGSVATIQNGQMILTLAPQSNGKGRGDVKRSTGAILYPPNYPIVAIKMKKPAVGNITFDTNLGSFGNGSNKWTGKVGEDVYYYDLNKTGFGAGPSFLSKLAPTTLTTFQFKVADITSGETSYSIDWIKTVKTVADLEKLVPHVTQTITFDSLHAVLIGDAPYAAGATASSGLPVTYTVSDTTIAVVLNGNIFTKKAGTVAITASQPGDSVYLAANAITRTLTVGALDLQVQYQDGDNGQTANNAVRPYLKLVSAAPVAVAYNELTIRYWFTAENYSGINTFIDYAQMGNSKVRMTYEGTQPRTGAYGYIEYAFDTTAGLLAAGGNSGPIQSRFANKDWMNLNETDDYSYVTNNAYGSNEHITVYRNGVLIAGTEPAAVTPVVAVKAFSENKNYSTTGNSISTYLSISNEGNVPVDYKDLSVRYWFTADGTSPLNYWVDYAVIGNNRVHGTFVAVNPGASGADNYLQVQIDSAAGALYPLSNTGNIRYRITKSNWSAFNEADDHSWKAPAPAAENDHITVYYKGQLVYGTEPAGAVVTGNGTQLQSAIADAAIIPAALYPNPLNGSRFFIKAGSNLVNTNVLVKVYDVFGKQVAAKKISNNTASMITIDCGRLSSGVYMVRVNDLPAMKLVVEN